MGGNCSPEVLCRQQVLKTGYGQSLSLRRIPSTPPARALERSAGFPSLRSPLRKVVPVNSQTKEIGGYEAHLRGPEADNADHDAIHAGDEPPVPYVSSDEDR